jgi:hypothetical protein
MSTVTLFRPPRDIMVSDFMSSLALESLIDTMRSTVSVGISITLYILAQDHSAASLDGLMFGIHLDDLPPSRDLRGGPGPFETSGLLVFFKTWKELARVELILGLPSQLPRIRKWHAWLSAKETSGRNSTASYMPANSIGVMTL